MMYSLAAARSSAPLEMSKLMSRVLAERPYPSISTHHVLKPRCANQSIADESGRPGTFRSNVGCEAMEEPCTKSTVGRLLLASPTYFSHRNSRTSPLRVQCSCALMLG